MTDSTNNLWTRRTAVIGLLAGVLGLWVTWSLPAPEIASEQNAAASQRVAVVDGAQTSQVFSPSEEEIAALDALRLQGSAPAKPKPRSVPQQAAAAAQAASLQLVGTVFVNGVGTSEAPDSQGLFRDAAGQLIVAGVGEAVGSVQVISIGDGEASVRINGRTQLLKTPRRIERERDEGGKP